MKFRIRFRVLLCAALAAGGLVETGSGTPPPAAMRTGPSGYVKWWPGELPVVLSAGHNGMQRPDTIPDRTYGTVTIVDSFSAKLAHAIRDAMRARFGQAPHLVICELSRRKVDCNREIVEGAQGNAAAARVWREYHGFIQQASQAVLATSPHGLYFDIHSHGHPKPRLEIGCLVPSSALRLPDKRLDGDPKIAARSSIREAARRSPAGFAELLRGPTSMGGLLEARGLAAIPSPRHRPEPKESVFTGGYAILAHGSRDKAQLDGMQLEFPKSMRDTAERRAATAKALAEATGRFFELHYGIKLPAADAAR